MGKNSKKRCCGSGSISTRYGSGSGSFFYRAKIVRKTLILTVLWLLWLFIFEKWCICTGTVASKSKYQKNLGKNYFLCPSWRSLTKMEWQDPAPDPLIRSTDPYQNGHGSATLQRKGKPAFLTNDLLSGLSSPLLGRPGKRLTSMSRSVMSWLTSSPSSVSNMLMDFSTFAGWDRPGMKFSLNRKNPLCRKWTYR